METCRPSLEIATRIEKLQEALVSAQLDGTLLLLNTDLFYFTGTVQSAFLFVPAAGEPVLMVKRGLERARAEGGIKHIVPIRSPREIPAVLQTFGYTLIERLGLELDVLPVNLYEFYQKIFAAAQCVDISPAVKAIRSIKSPYEIELLRAAMKVMGEAFAKVPSLLKENMSEIELAALFEAELRRRGYSGPAKMRTFNQEFFYGNVCSGNSGLATSFFDGPVGGSGTAAANPQGAGWKKIQRDEPVYIDYTCVFEGYTGDQTRMFCIGDLTPRLKQAFQDMLVIQKEVLSIMSPGVLAEEPYLLALKLAEEMGYKDHFMGYKENQVKFIGHGIGLELDEWPIIAKGIKQPLLPGMTFALEPKLVFEEGAIGIENSFVMTETGPEYLHYTPEDIVFLK